MSAALVSSTFFGDFGDHYRSNGSTALQTSPKNSFGSQLVDKSSIYNTVQQINNNNNIINNNINNALSNTTANSNVNVMSRRLVTTTNSVPLNLNSHRLQTSTTVPAMHQKSLLQGVNQNNTQTPPPPITLVRGLTTQCSLTNNNIINNNNNNTINANIGNKEHKKLDRSYSEPAEKQCQQQLVRLNSTSAAVAGPMSSRYKTELCRSFGEVGTCKYGDKCQFAHGGHELRIITRHPKFKTENCKSFHSTGFCPYGPRCHFIHNSEEQKKSIMNNLGSADNNTSPQNGGNIMTSNGHNNNNNNNNNMMNNMNLNNANNSMVNHLSQAFGTAFQSNQSLHTLRPKSLSIGSYSLGSSGEISPPSSQSGSPTSLNSFFTEDPFNAFISPANQALGTCANNAFSFSPDFQSLMSSNKSGFSGSQPTLCPPFGLNGNLNNEITNGSIVMPNLFSNQLITSNMSDGMTSSLSTTPPPQTPKGSYPMAPDSPVDSIASDVEALKLDQTSGSPMDVNKSLPRLPIFARFSINGGSDE